jgi:uncharacterized protein YkwD
MYIKTLRGANRGHRVRTLRALLGLCAGALWLAGCQSGTVSVPAGGDSRTVTQVDEADGSVGEALGDGGDSADGGVEGDSSTPPPVIDPCAPNPCGVGSCTPSGDGYACGCPEGYNPSEGTCVAVTPPPPNACTPTNPCGVGACTPNGAAYTCACPANTHTFNGTTCVPVAPPPNPCAPNPCGVGTCAPSGGSYACTCPDGYVFDTGSCRLACTLGTPEATSVFCPAARWPSAWSTMENTVLTLINQRRAAGADCGGTVGVKAPTNAVSRHANLDIAARSHALDMAVRSYSNHITAKFCDTCATWSFFNRMMHAGYTNSMRHGETIAPGQGTAEGVVSAWMASPGHCEVLMEPKVQHIGIGYAVIIDPAQPLVPRRHWVAVTGCRGDNNFSCF